MTIVRAGFARGEAIAALPRRCIAVAAVLVLAGCASPHPAPIVHRAPPPPVAAQPPAVPQPSAVSGTASTAAATGAAAAAGSAADAVGVQTTPIARGPVESRPLPGAPGVVGAPSGAAAAPSSAAAGNLLKTEPKALKQPYSEAALAQMRSTAPPATEPIPPLASAAPSAAAAGAARTPAADAAAAAASSAAGSAAPAPAASGASDWIWPASGQVVQDFAQPSSMGIAISGKPGDPIVAVNDGRVIFSGAGPRSYGNLVIVKHGDDTLSVYAHNRTLLVKEGQSVKRGQRIAELGSSGTDAPKLHFEIRRDGRPVDPRKVLPAR